MWWLCSPPKSDDFEQKVDLSPVPVLCHSLDTQPALIIPAVRVKHPQGVHAYFPLSQLELGEIWFNQTDLAPWRFEVLSTDWMSTTTVFHTHVDYPVAYLINILSVLRRQEYMDKTPLGWCSWPRVCKGTTSKLYGLIGCVDCGAMRKVSMRLIATFGRSPYGIRCVQLDCVCGQPSDGICCVNRSPALHLHPPPPDVPKKSVAATPESIRPSKLVCAQPQSSTCFDRACCLCL